MLFERVDKGFDKSTLSRDLEIELNKQMSKTMKRIHKTLKTGTCYFCGKPIASFCNSHNVPRYCLENIGTNGEVLGPNAILELPRMGLSIGKHTPGINESGTFSMICRECDSTIFQDYENPENYYQDKVPTSRMLTQIALKNYLKVIYKRKIEIALMEDTVNRLPPVDLPSILLLKEYQEKLKVSALDLESYKSSFERAKMFFESRKDNGYYLFYYKLLDYVAPITIQIPIVISIGFGDEIINDVFSMNPNYEPKDLHVCVFPQQTTTAILLFVDYGNTRYSRFRRQFLKLDEESKLGIINYIVFLYSEDYFLAKDLSQKMDLTVLKEIANITPVIRNIGPINGTSVLTKKYSLSKWKDIPNLLSEKYKIR